MVAPNLEGRAHGWRGARRTGKDESPVTEPPVTDCKVLGGSYDHDINANGTVQDGAHWQQLSAVGILSSLTVSQRGFTGANETKS